MQIFVKTLTGRIYSLDVKHYETIEDVKAKIKVLEGICPSRQRLIFSGWELLEYTRILSDLGIS